MRWLTEIKEVIEHYRWCCILAWRVVNGRFFVLRDAPLHVVATWAAFEDRPDDPPEALALKRQARDELDLRMRQMTRQIEQLAVDLAAAVKPPEESKP